MACVAPAQLAQQLQAGVCVEAKPWQVEGSAANHASLVPSIPCSALTWW